MSGQPQAALSNEQLSLAQESTQQIHCHPALRCWTLPTLSRQCSLSPLWNSLGHVCSASLTLSDKEGGHKSAHQAAFARARSCTRILAELGLASSTMLSIVADHKEFPDHVSVRLVTDDLLLWPHASLCTHLAATSGPVPVHQQRSDRSVCRLAANSGQRPHRSEASSGAAVPLQVRPGAPGHLYVDQSTAHIQSDPHLAVQHPDTGEAGRHQAEHPSRSVPGDCCARIASTALYLWRDLLNHQLLALL